MPKGHWCPHNWILNVQTESLFKGVQRDRSNATCPWPFHGEGINKLQQVTSSLFTVTYIEHSDSCASMNNHAVFSFILPHKKHINKAQYCTNYYMGLRTEQYHILPRIKQSSMGVMTDPKKFRVLIELYENLSPLPHFKEHFINEICTFFSYNSRKITDMRVLVCGA